MKITKFHPDPLRVTYELKHVIAGREGTTLTQNLVISKQGSQWIADIRMDGFPECETPDMAATKLGEWLYRLSTVIMEEEGNFGKLDLTNIHLEKS